MEKAAQNVMKGWSLGGYANPRELDLLSVRLLISNAAHGRRPGGGFVQAGPAEFPSGTQRNCNAKNRTLVFQKKMSHPLHSTPLHAILKPKLHDTDQPCCEFELERPMSMVNGGGVNGLCFSVFLSQPTPFCHFAILPFCHFAILSCVSFHFVSLQFILQRCSTTHWCALITLERNGMSKY